VYRSVRGIFEGVVIEFCGWLDGFLRLGHYLRWVGGDLGFVGR